MGSIYQNGMRTQPDEAAMQEEQQGADQDDTQYTEAELAVILSAIEDVIRDESSDRYYFGYLLTMTPDDSDAEIINSIRIDAVRHIEMFRQLYFELSGRNPKELPALPFEQPLTYCVGLRNALLEELTEVVNYREILAGLKGRRHINALTALITDELRHMGLFMNLYIKNECDV